jgi:phasin
MAQTPFEIPQQLRELTEKNVEQARAAYGQFMDAIAQTMGLWETAMPTSEMSSGLKAIQERSIQFVKQNADSYFALASELTKAKDIQHAFAIQSRYALTQMETYTRQAQELGRLIAEAAQSI